jgi:hypothetical protein
MASDAEELQLVDMRPDEAYPTFEQTALCSGTAPTISTTIWGSCRRRYTRKPRLGKMGHVRTNGCDFARRARGAGSGLLKQHVRASNL